ncbi:TrlF family AAA-like ATPase [Flavicella sp.]|uniref:TrlF family AAA-like ATPase n=1 Tax=Flavicella sp. TaxID=2957742 RepID=UPI0030189346
MPETLLLNRGSVWTKWDLQVQPIKNNWLGKTDIETLSKIEISTQKYIKVAKEKNIEVIAITDHNSGVAIDYALNTNEITVLPGVELDTREGWHLLIIFNEKYKEKSKLEKWSEVIDNFLANKCKIERPFFNEDNTHKKINTTTKELISEVWNNEIGIVVFAHCMSNDGFFKKSDVQGRKEIIDYLIKGNIYFAFEIKNNFEQITEINEKIRGWYPNNQPEIPILSSSDAHKASDVGMTYSLIKAEKCYEGLKQVLFEPTDRLIIGSEENDSKTDYSVIQSIRYIDDNFFPQEIPLNQNLCTIIGGKSTGKSLLLRSMAQAIDIKEVSDRHKEVNLELFSKKVKGFEVVWRDGQISKLNNDDNPSKKIIYIPQSYLNRLVEKSEEETSIDDIIKNVLVQDIKIKNAFDDLESNNNLLQSSIATDIEKLEQKVKQFRLLSNNIKSIGDKKGIESEIKKIEKQITDLKEKSGLNTTKIDNYTKLTKEKADLIKEQAVVHNDFESLKRLKIDYSKIVVTPSFNSISSEIQSFLSSKFQSIKTETDNKWLNILNLKIQNLDAELTKQSQGMINIDKSLRPFSSKINNSKILNQLQEKLEQEKRKLNNIQLEQNKVDELNTEIINLIDNLAENSKNFYTNLINAKSVIIKQELIKDEMDFEIDVLFKENAFQKDFVIEVFNGTKLSTYARSNDLKIDNYKFETIEKFKTNFKKLILDFINHKIETIKRYDNLSSSLSMLLKNWFVFDFKLTSQEDRFNDMSAGKKAFILLKLLIDLDKSSKYPILLDQPEDDWDNRSLYSQLRKFIKQKKKERQIIIVTHNPNLVVGTDCEQVIVANQNSNSTPNHNYKFEYCSGALENSKLRINDTKISILNRQGIKEHVCDILEGGEVAFKKREQKYGISTAHNTVYKSLGNK